MKHLLKLFLILIIAGIYPMARLFFTEALSNNIIFYYNPYLYDIITFWLFGIWYFGFLIYGAISFWKNVGQAHFMIKFVVPIVLIIVSVLGFFGLSGLSLFVSFFTSPYKLEYKCDGYDIASKPSGNEGIAKYYYGIQNNNVVKIGSKEYIKDCQAKITIKILSTNQTNYDEVYSSPFATQSEIIKTPQVRSVLGYDSSAKVTEYIQGSLIAITIKDN